jgi:hypothetical protein
MEEADDEFLQLCVSVSQQPDRDTFRTFVRVCQEVCGEENLLIFLKKFGNGGFIFSSFKAISQYFDF